jgi:hypothetical protein
MISFKTFLKIRHPEWEYEKLVFVPKRPNISKMVKANKSYNDLPDLLLTIYNGSKLRDEILNKESSI